MCSEAKEQYCLLAFNAALRAAIEYYMGGKGDNKHSFSSERINNVMSRSIKLYTHNDTGHKSCKDTDNKATHNNTRNGNLIDIRDKARKCTWRYTNNDTRNICVMLHAIKPYPQMMSAITTPNDTRNDTPNDTRNNNPQQYP